MELDPVHYKPPCASRSHQVDRLKPGEVVLEENRRGGALELPWVEIHRADGGFGISGKEEALPPQRVSVHLQSLGL